MNGRTGQHPRDNDPLRETYLTQLDILAEKLLAFALPVTESRRERLLRYATLVARRAQEFNLVSRKDLMYVVEKHIAASLGSLLLLEPGPGEIWVDIGSGAGFPGLVLKIWEPEQSVLLVESSAKRCVFLEEASRALRLDAIPVQMRGEDLFPEHALWKRFEYEGIERRVFVTRAVDPLDRALTWLPSQLRSGDRWLYYTGPGWESALSRLRGELDDARLDFERCHQIPWALGRIMEFTKRDAPSPSM